jgi:hypothetical protein
MHIVQYLIYQQGTVLSQMKSRLYFLCQPNCCPTSDLNNLFHGGIKRRLKRKRRQFIFFNKPRLKTRYLQHSIIPLLEPHRVPDLFLNVLIHHHEIL